jgi:hypothetical protein
VKLVRRLETTSRLFVRQDASSLFYGTHAHTNNSHHHREWLIEGTNLETSERYPPVQLDDFVGTDLGLTVCFEIYNGYFYALSNQTSFDLEEIDWTSYYHCIRFPVADPTAVQTTKRIWRRQHIEGPINDTWTSLLLPHRLTSITKSRFHPSVCVVNNRNPHNTSDKRHQDVMAFWWLTVCCFEKPCSFSL